MKKIIPVLALLTLMCCKEKPQKKNQESVRKTPAAPVSENTAKDAVYKEFKPERIQGLKMKGFNVNGAFSIDGNTFVAGSYESVDGNITLPDTEKDWSKRLLVLNSNKEIIYKSPGTGETYLYEPHFYRNNQDGNIIIVCQLAYEYFFGGDAFILKDGKIKYLGNLDIEPNNEEKSITDVLKIKESKDGITFTFDADSLVLKPGNEDKVIKNNQVKYLYDGSSLKLYQ
ncbi:hypothetical protein ACKW6Q_03985 [Chryseobacterium kwangjuense]|uniref:Lipoprotein n=1 Tax=Chryseobacterium kwangjuense TaxID=267125 RepID=A0ABW9K0F4_9FLAO